MIAQEKYQFLLLSSQFQLRLVMSVNIKSQKGIFMPLSFGRDHKFDTRTVELFLANDMIKSVEIIAKFENPTTLKRDNSTVETRGKLLLDENGKPLKHRRKKLVFSLLIDNDKFLVKTDGEIRTFRTVGSALKTAVCIGFPQIIINASEPLLAAYNAPVTYTNNKKKVS